MIQRLFGISMAFSADQELSLDARRRIGEELKGALHDLRTALGRPLGRTARPTQMTFAEEFGRLADVHPELGLSLNAELRVPEQLEPLAQSVLVEAVRNASKHADPTQVDVSVERIDDTFVMEICNDGVHGRPRPASGMGLRLAALEAIQAGGIIEFGEREPGVWRCDWRCRLGVPDVNPSRLGSGGTGDRRLRVLVVDDHEVVHWGFRLMLGEQPWVERCLSARNGEEAITLARRYEPHVALVDLFVGQESGAEICERLRFLVPNTNVLLISGAGRISPNAARAAGAAGFISKDWPAADIAGAVRMVGLGMTVFKPHESPGGPPLTDREREVLDLVAGGATNREIAERLFLSPHTIKEHTSSLYRKLGVRNRAEAVQKAQRLGLIA